MKLDRDEIAVRRDPDGDHKSSSAPKSWAEVYAALDAADFPDDFIQDREQGTGATLVSHDAGFPAGLRIGGVGGIGWGICEGPEFRLNLQRMYDLSKTRVESGERIEQEVRVEEVDCVKGLPIYVPHSSQNRA